jgi:hypothetical protein
MKKREINDAFRIDGGKQMHYTKKKELKTKTKKEKKRTREKEVPRR